MKKVVVFGGSGFLGSHVADELTNRGYAVVVADIKESPYILDKQTFVHCDIMDASAIAAALEDAVFVYNFAGFADLDASTHQPRETMEQNVIGNINILEICREMPIERYVYASSAYAFSNKGSFYGISKFASEKVIEEYESRYDLPYTIVRYGSLYGERADDHNAIHRLLRQAIETGRMVHPGHGEEVREYIHAADAAKLSVDIIEDDAYINEHLVLTGVERLRYKDLLRMIQEILDNNVDIILSDNGRAGHYEVTPYSYHPNVARKLVSNSFIDLGQGLVSCIKHIHSSVEKND